MIKIHYLFGFKALTFENLFKGNLFFNNFILKIVLISIINQINIFTRLENLKTDQSMIFEIIIQYNEIFEILQIF